MSDMRALSVRKMHTTGKSEFILNLYSEVAATNGQHTAHRQGESQFMKTSNRLLPGLLAGSLMLGGVSGAFASAPQKAAGKFGVAAGQVANLSGTGFTLTRTVKSATVGGTPTTLTLAVTVSATTKEVARKGTTGTLTNGEYVLVAGKKSTSGIVARRVIFSSKPFRAGLLARKMMARHTLKAIARRQHRVAGTVTGTTATSLTLQTLKGKPLTFGITTATRFHVNGQLQASEPTFTAGERVIVRFVRNKTTKSLVARAINVRAAAPKA